MIIFIISWISLGTIIVYIAYKKFKRDEKEMEEFWEKYEKYDKKWAKKELNNAKREYNQLEKVKRRYQWREEWEELLNDAEQNEKNKGELFKSFETYYLAHENQRFWQCLRNWSKYDAIEGVKLTLTTKEREETFYKEGR